MQQSHPRPPAHRRRWLHCGFAVQSSRIRQRCSSPFCVTSGPAYSHIHAQGRLHIWLMRFWRHKCHLFRTTCFSVVPTKGFRIHWSFVPLWSATSLNCTPSSHPPGPHPVIIINTSLSQKMGCLGNSKTEDQRNEEKVQRENNKKINKQLQKDKQIYRATHRLLLLGGFCVIYCYCVCVLSKNQLMHFKKKVCSISNPVMVKSEPVMR